MDALDGIGSLVSDRFKEDVPTNIEFIYFLFFDKGISLVEFNELPIPYIWSILKTHRYIKQEEEKAAKRAAKRK